MLYFLIQRWRRQPGAGRKALWAFGTWIASTLLMGASNTPTPAVATSQPALQQQGNPPEAKPVDAAPGEELYIRPTATITGPLTVDVTAETNIPDGAVFGVSMRLANQAPEDVYIGTQGPQEQDGVVANGKISVQLNGAAIGDLPALPNGDYEVRVIFSPIWDENKDIAASLGMPTDIIDNGTS